MNSDFQTYSTYLQLTGKTISDALYAFKNLDKVESAEVGDRFFESFGTGNFIQIIDRPYERLICYEFLLKVIRRESEDKFNVLHKGSLITS